MPLRIIKQDITKISCDAIVNPSDMFYSGGGGTDYAIHKAAGRELMDAACAELPPLETGTVEVTDGFNLPVRYVFHTTGPVWEGGDFNEPVLLRSCYLNALIKANRMGLKSVAFPLISSGTFGFPKDRVLRIATEAITDFLFTAESDMEVFICIVDKNAYELSRADELRNFIENAFGNTQNAEVCYSMCEEVSPCEEDKFTIPKACAPIPCASVLQPAPAPAPKPAQSLADFIRQKDLSFAEMLFELIEKKETTMVECYKKANISKNIASKIKINSNYRPSKNTVLAFAIALQLNLEETEQLLKTVGLSMSTYYLFDRIVEFYISSGIYNIFEINEALFQYDQETLGNCEK